MFFEVDTLIVIKNSKIKNVEEILENKIELRTRSKSYETFTYLMKNLRDKRMVDAGVFQSPLNDSCYENLPWFHTYQLKDVITLPALKEIGHEGIRRTSWQPRICLGFANGKDIDLSGNSKESCPTWILINMQTLKIKLPLSSVLDLIVFFNLFLLCSFISHNYNDANNNLLIPEAGMSLNNLWSPFLSKIQHNSVWKRIKWSYRENELCTKL